MYEIQTQGYVLSVPRKKSIHYNKIILSDSDVLKRLLTRQRIFNTLVMKEDGLCHLQNS